MHGLHEADDLLLPASAERAWGHAPAHSTYLPPKSGPGLAILPASPAHHDGRSSPAIEPGPVRRLHTPSPPNPDGPLLPSAVRDDGEGTLFSTRED
jgi:hypothetical protein